MAGTGYLLAALLVLCISTDGSHGAKILGVFPFLAKSHMISFTVLMQELARRGHEVTVISHFPVKPPIPHHKDIVLENTFPERESENLFAMGNKSISLDLLFLMWNVGIMTCERAMVQPEIQKFIHTKDLHFDVIFYEGFYNDCFFGLVHKLNAPIIQISSNIITLWMGDPVGNPHTSSYIPDFSLGYTHHMDFKQRLANTLISVFHQLSRDFYYLPKQDKVMWRHMADPSIPSISILEKMPSLLLLNSHFSTGFPRPLTPNTIEVGGMHIKSPQKLPKDLQKFMDDAPYGVIYFSLGTNVKATDMPEEMRQALLDSFASLKQKVLWKWESDTLPGLPPNVRLGKWLPQNDILGHPNLKLFMTHGGLLSTQEALHHGIPILAIPVVGDQLMNSKQAVASGYALLLEIKNITKESLDWALDELLNKPHYLENAKKKSAIVRDRPQTPLDTAVYWTEYIIRHKGASHMRSAALDLWWYQYYLLDVLSVLFGVVGLVVVMIWSACRALYRAFRSKGTRQQARSKKTN